MSAKLVSITMLLLLPALTGAQPAVRCSGPLSEVQLTALLKGSVPAPRIGQNVASCGIDFEADGEAISRLRSAGAPETILDAVRAATGPAERKRRAEQASWEPIKDSEDPAAFEDYLRQYPEGQFAAAARQKYRDLKVAGIRAEMDRTLAAGQWDAADGEIRDLLRVVSEDGEIKGWQRQITEGREKLRLEKEAAARTVVPPTTIAPGTKKVNPKDGLTYVWIPPGTFMMGCSPGDNECFDNEKPAHQVTVTKGFWLGQTPVTQQAYERVTGQNPSLSKGAYLPVERVDWSEAKAYCVATGGRLPTEAEWEYAARAGSTGARYGNLDEIAWYPNNLVGGRKGSSRRGVGQKLANAFGLFDMLGNVYQWVADWYGNYQPGAQTDPSGAESGRARVLRGGLSIIRPALARASFRNNSGLPSLRNPNFSVRCVGELDATPSATDASAGPTKAAIFLNSLTAGSKKVNPKDGLSYVWIPQGKFMMGCSRDDNECDSGEKPPKEVEISPGFWLGQTSVTVGAWKRYRAATGKPALPTNDRWGRKNLNEASGDDNMPVVMVTWEEARGFCEWSEGRLPTEAEWEYAARAGTTGARYWSLDEIAWYEDNSGKRWIDSQKIRVKPPYVLTYDGNDRLFKNGNGPHPVGQKQPNAWNLYDMLGNVWQWMADPVVGRWIRPLRGGSWSFWPGAVRVALGNSAPESTRSSSFGVRCVGN